MDEKTFECEFCKKSFIKYGNLISHQKTAKYCLQIRGKTNEEYKCDFCDKVFTVYRTLNNHEKICIEKIKNDENQTHKNLIKENRNLVKENKNFKKEIELYKKQIEKLENTISQLALSKMNAINTTNTTNNINMTNSSIVVHNHTLNLNDTKLIENVLDENLDGDVLAAGQKGLARMIYEKLLKGPDGKSSYKCVDSSRHNFEYVDEHGKLEKDVKGVKLKQALIKGDICKKAMDVGPELWSNEDGSVDNTRFNIFSNKVFEVANINNDDSKFRSELSVLTS